VEPRSLPPARRARRAAAPALTVEPDTAMLDDLLRALRSAGGAVLLVALVPGNDEEGEERIAETARLIEAAVVASGGGVEPATRLLGATTASQDVYRDALLSVDFRQRRVDVSDRELRLTPLEFRLLAALVRNPKQVLSHEQLFELAWGSDWVSREQLRLAISYLRRKLGPEGRAAIETVRGFGYRYEAPG
jgi:DNA-binding response OmpR family regulator